MFRNRPVLYSGLALVVLGGLTGTILSAFAGNWFISGLSVLLTLGGAAGFVYWWLYTICTTLIVTNERTILRYGIIAKHTNEVQHDDVTNLQVNQNVWQRIFGIGDIMISSSGQDGIEIQAEGIVDPDGVSSTIRSCQ